jgi:Flp pilus assembly protein TadG
MKDQVDSLGQTMALKRSLDRAAKSGESHAGRAAFARRVRALLRSGEQGQSMVEFALAMPAVLAVITATFTFSIAFYSQMTLTTAVSAGAQDLQTIRQTTSDPCKDTLTAIEAAAPNLSAANISLTVTINGTAEPGHTCTGATSVLAAAQGEPVAVTATYPCFLSIMNAGYKANFISNCQLSAKATVYEY